MLVQIVTRILLSKFYMLVFSVYNRDEKFSYCCIPSCQQPPADPYNNLLLILMFLIFSTTKIKYHIVQYTLLHEQPDQLTLM